MNYSKFDGTELAVGSVYGLRAFKVDELGRLRAVHHDTLWTPGENIATCMAETIAPGWKIDQELSLTHSHAIYRNGDQLVWECPTVLGNPEEHSIGGCTCGFYAFYDGTNEYADTDRVTAVVEGYGETVIGTKGFRARKARIIAIHVPHMDAEKVRVSEKVKKPRFRFWPTTTTISHIIAGGASGGGAFAFYSAGDLIRGTICTGVVVTMWVAAWKLPWKLQPKKSATVEVTRKTTFQTVDASQSYDSYRRTMSFMHDVIVKLSKTTIERIRHNYPDVPVYASLEEMLEKHPLSTAISPSPENDPNFWSNND